MITPIPNYETHYGATPDGRIFSFNYRGTKGCVHELAQSSLYDKRRKTKSMYRRVKAYWVNPKTPTAVHRLIAQTFLPNPNSLPQVNHKNGDKADNRVENLEWCTVGDNVRHSESSGLADHPQGEDHPAAKLTEVEVLEIRELAGDVCDIAEIYGVSKYCIYDIRNRKSWRHI